MNKKDSTKFILKRLFSFYIKKHYSKLFFAIFCMVLVSAATAINAWLMQPVLDDIFIKKNEALIFIIPFSRDLNNQDPPGPSLLLFRRKEKEGCGGVSAGCQVAFFFRSWFRRNRLGGRTAQR